MKTFSFKVTLKGRFPLDQIRYDRCTPMSDKDALLMLENGWRTINMVGVHPPTVGRWESFGVAVIE